MTRNLALRRLGGTVTLLKRLALSLDGPGSSLRQKRVASAQHRWLGGSVAVAAVAAPTVIARLRGA